jgi:hypothetical protein
LTRFGVGEVFKQGGALREIITWSVDSGSGMRDQTIFISSLGDVVVYQGFDPDDSRQLDTGRRLPLRRAPSGNAVRSASAPTFSSSTRTVCCL